MFAFGHSTETLTLHSSLTAAGTTVASAADIQLIKNPNPYILHGDTAHGNDWYLSVDIRVFQMKAGQTRFGVHVGNTGVRRSVATSFIQQAISNLNGSPGSAGALFEALPSAEDTASLALAPNDVNSVPVYNFALARVRLRDTTQGRGRASLLPHVGRPGLLPAGHAWGGARLSGHPGPLPRAHGEHRPQQELGPASAPGLQH
jgi:hypothetical protein